MSDGIRSLKQLRLLKQRAEKIVALTAYDACSSRLLDEAGVDVILVGDSLSNVIQGHPDTLHATLDHMVYHTACVSRAAQRALILADMPFMSYCDPLQAAKSAQRLVQEGGAQAVKLEGGRGRQIEVVRFLVEQHVPVCGHLGLQPQSIYQVGAYAVQGRDSVTADQLLKQARELETAGAQLLVLECIPQELAGEITAMLSIPTIGIGAGVHCDGQVLVLQDMLGMTGVDYRFCKDFLKESPGSIASAIYAYVEAVRTSRFPDRAHSFSIHGEPC